MNFYLDFDKSISNETRFMDAVRNILSTQGEGVAVGYINVARVEGNLVMTYGGRQVNYEPISDCATGFWLNCEASGVEGKISIVLDHTNDDLIESAWITYNWLVKQKFSTDPT